MELLSLTLRNFKGIKDFTLDAQGGNIDIYGANAAGKTTILDGFLWLLFGKDSQNRADFDVKTLDKTGNVLHGLEHEVEAVLGSGGRELSLRKVYKEKWTQKRGAVKREFTGHETDHYIDGVPVPKKDYTAKIAEIIEEDIFKLLTSPTFFNAQLHWKDRRRTLLEICGDISDDEVIASDKNLAKLPDILNGRKLDDHRKVIAQRRKAINDELEKIPVRIDEIERGLPDISEIKEDKLSDDIAKLRKQAKEKEQEIVRIQNGGEIPEKKREMAEIGADLQELRNSHREMLDSKVGELREDLQVVYLAVGDKREEVDLLGRSIKSYEQEIATLDVRLEHLRNDWHKVNDRVFNFNQDENCPTCGQDLPQERLDEARKKALAQFNQQKSTDLEQINEEGSVLSQRKEKILSEIADSRKKLDKATADLKSLEQKEADLRSKIGSIMNETQPVESTLQYKEIMDKKDALQQEIAELETGGQDAIASVQQEISELENDTAALEKTAAQVEQNRTGQHRIEQLKDQEKDLAAEFEQLESELYLTEEFIRTKVSLLEEKINSKFEMARFKLFDVQVNGGVEETCETLYQGVPFSSLNNAARINVGLDIIRTLSEHYGFTAPIFIDNAEAVTDLIETPGQQIRLVVSKKDKKLRVVFAELQQALFGKREAV